MPVTVSGSGRSYSILNNSFTNASTGTVISPTDGNAAHADVAAGINTALNLAQIEGQRRLMGIQAYTATPPGSPADGQVWLVATGATGVWTGKDKKFAAYTSGSYQFFDPIAGDIAVIVSTLQGYQYDASNVWQPWMATFVGDSGSGGQKGLVPGPVAGDAAAAKFLSANGTWSAIAVLVANISNATTIGRNILLAADAAAERALIGSPPTPQTTGAGVGQVVAQTSSAGGSLSAPAGGSWLSMYLGFSSTAFTLNSGFSANVVAGGSVIVAGTSGVLWTAISWRIV